MRKDNKIFIPLTLDNSTKSVWGTGQFVGVGTAVVAIVFLQIFLIIYYGENAGLTWFATPFVLIPLDIAIVYFIVWLVRKFIFKENELLRAYESNKNNEIADLSFLWDIFNIENGKIYYLNGYVAAVVQFKHGYIYDRPDMHKDIHRKTVQQAIGAIARRGYMFKYYNREVRDSNLEPLYHTKDLIAKEAGSRPFNLITDILNHVERVCTDIGTIEVETYVVIATDMYTIQGLDLAVEEMIAATRNGLFTFAERLDDDGIYNFICSLYDITSIDSDKILSRKFRDSNLQVVKQLEVMRDISGQQNTQTAKAPATVESDDYMKQFEDMLRDSSRTSEENEGDYL